MRTKNETTGEARAKLEDGLRTLIRAVQDGELTRDEAGQQLGVALIEGFLSIASDAEIREPAE